MRIIQAIASPVGLDGVLEPLLGQPEKAEQGASPERVRSAAEAALVNLLAISTAGAAQLVEHELALAVGNLAAQQGLMPPEHGLNGQKQAAHFLRQPLDSALLHPLGITALLLIQRQALARQWRGKPAEWKGRSYQATTCMKPFKPA